MALIDVNVQRNVNVFFRNQRFDDVQDDGGGGEVADPERTELLRDAERLGRERNGTVAQHQGHRSDNIWFYPIACIPSLWEINVFSRVCLSACLQGRDLHITMTCHIGNPSP